MTIQPGQPLPSVPVKHVTAEGIADATTSDILGTGKVVLFTVPGAFTPTCHLNHLPGYVAAADAFKQAGVDKVVCATVNDHHVVKAWAEATGAFESVEFIADGLAAFALALGLEREMTGGMGIRFGRNALVIVDGVVKLVANEATPGVVTSSGAPAILEALAAM